MTEFDRWVSENNPDSRLEYGKGWWDFVEIIRRVCAKLEIDDVSTAATFPLRTPPPEEVLNSPVVCLKSRHFTAHVKWDFGMHVDPWTVSLTHQARKRPLAAFLGSEPLTERALEGFSPAWIYPSLPGWQPRLHGPAARRAGALRPAAPADSEGSSRRPRSRGPPPRGPGAPPGHPDPTRGAREPAGEVRRPLGPGRRRLSILPSEHEGVLPPAVHGES